MTFPLTPEQLRQINRLALEARFVSGMAHELNNSMQVMSGLVELLIDRPACEQRTNASPHDVDPAQHGQDPERAPTWRGLPD